MGEIISLKKNYEFQRLYKKGVSAPQGPLVLICSRNRLGVNRLGITVSKKIGKANVRNRAKRKLKEAFRLSSGKLKTGYDIVLVARTRTAEEKFDSILRAFMNAARKAEIVEAGK